MKRFYLFFLTVLLCAVSSAQVTVDIRLDSVQFFVGQQDGLELQVTIDARQKLQFPVLKPGDQLVPDVEVVEILKPDTQQLDQGNRLQITQRYIITAWDSSFYYLPPMEVLVDKKPYQSKSLALKVYTLDVDTLHTDQFFPPRDIQTVPFCWEDWKGIVYSVVVCLLMAALIVYLIWRIRTGKPIFRLVRHKKHIPAHQVALDQIQKIKDERTWATEDSKEYYTQLTDTLRTYIQDRYGFNAMEMTSEEIIGKLTEEKDSKRLDELRDIFRTADLVKFAKWTTQINENDAALMSALWYVNDTKPEVDPNAQPEPEIVKETDRERLNQVIATQVVIGIAALIIVSVAIWMGFRLWDLLR